LLTKLPFTCHLSSRLQVASGLSAFFSAATASAALVVSYLQRQYCVKRKKLLRIGRMHIMHSAHQPRVALANWMPSRMPASILQQGRW
jgi:hypothetical protein